MTSDLDATARAWVSDTFDALDLDAKIGQLLLPIQVDLTDTAALDRLLAAGVGGVSRPTGKPPEQLRESAGYLQRHSRVPLLLSGDLDFDELRAVGGPAGTQLPNQLALAASADPELVRRVARAAVAEGRWCGFNWSFTPVVDIDRNPDNPVVNTRSFGSDPARITDLAVAYVQAMQSAGMAACAKHWPGDGIDDRDQHLVTSVNSLDLDDWRATFGEIYRAMITAGVRTIMAGHISLPAAVADPDRAHLPATLSRELIDLLRTEFSFDGVVVSDASEMAGFTSHGPRAELVVDCIAAGCDVLLYCKPEDAGHLRAAVDSGELPIARLDEAVLRVLRLKASLGLHLDRGPWDTPYATAEHAALADDVARSAVTLVKDTQRLLPLSPQRHHRLLLITEPQRRNVFGPLPELSIGDLLTAAGFEVTRHRKDTVVSADDFDAVVYVVAHEARQGKVSLRLRWDELHGGFPMLMHRYWHVLPTVFVSLGNPYHLYEVPRCPTYVNAYSPVLPVQRALVDALTGRIPFRGSSPVDPFTGLDPRESS